jgi:hypothetical protein
MEALIKGFLPLRGKRESKTTLLLLFAIMMSPLVQARENANQGGKMSQKQQQGLTTLAGSCAPATAQTDLDINNVRTTILAGGDMWWDLVSAKYEIPKGGGKHSLFAGALWIGGIDGGGNLKVAAMTYRQNGNDFWPGPLDANASVSNNMCVDYDKHFKITRAEVDEYVANGTMTSAIANWPGNSPYGGPMAPYVDADGSGHYNPSSAPGSDYPAYDVLGTGAGTLYGDQTLWWVFNDGGNIHTESGSEPIGLEIQAQAFAFSTNDEINNMTFYNYKIINRSTNVLNQAYFGQWVDADLGNYTDDYVGCDVERGLGYCYNGDQNDEGLAGYGLNPPAIGVDFFQGPVADPFDNVDNDRDCIIDEPGEQIIMSRFVYYNNDNSVTGNPDSRTDFYYYLKGLWKDGTPMTYGGNGYGGSTPCKFMFPGDSDHTREWGTGGTCANPAGIRPDWYESVTPGDRRFLQSAGPFTLQPGAVNYITTGVVWAQALQGGPLASVELVKTADDKAQALFDNNFKLLDGPDAPKLTIQELDKELLLYITNEQGSNNFNELYEEVDPLIIGAVDNKYRFEGYQVFQLKDHTVSPSELHNPDKARLVAQCDVKNFRPDGSSVGQLVNFEYDPALNANVPIEEVNGANEGVVHSFRVTEDKFAAGDKRLVNHKQYYYMVITYAYNEYKPYDQSDPALLDGQKKPYKAGRNGIKVYTGIPHIPSPEAYGTIQASEYGSGPKLKRIEGQGNGGQNLDLTPGTVSEILAHPQHRSFNPVYEAGRGPVNIKVIDPLNVPEGEFKLILDQPATAGKWMLINLTTNDTVKADKTIAVANEQIIPKWGLSVTMAQALKPGTNTTNNNGYIEATMQFTDATKPWLTGIADQDGPTPLNWIRSGTTAFAGNAAQYSDYSYSIDNQGSVQGTGLDDNEVYEKVLGGTWAPYRLTSTNAYGPAWNQFLQLSNMNKLASVDLVITNDPTKWTRCAIVEMCEEKDLAEGKAKKLNLRMAPSVGKDGNPDGSGTKGLGWFPGYAINVETGERLNIMFGENSFNAGENGRDMKWNPTSTIWKDPANLVMGGQHYIYIMGHSSASGMPAYDEASYIFSKLSANGTYEPGISEKREVYTDAMWVGIPLVTPGRSLNETDVKIRLRVTRPYDKNWAVDGNPTPENNNNPVYTFNTSELRVVTNDLEAAKNALDLINIVPNPYYAYSAYETNQLDNRVKITNLPQKCSISIYTVNGTLIRRYKKDEPKTSLDWDLKNQAGIPVASGLYIVHVDVEGVGEKILKWFGVMRPQDLDTF